MGCGTSKKKRSLSSSGENDSDKLSKTFQTNFTKITSEETSEFDVGIAAVVTTNEGDVVAGENNMASVVQQRATIIHNHILSLVEIMMQIAKNDKEKGQAHVFKADHFYKHAMDLRNNDSLDNFCTFQKALEDYIAACEADKNNISAIIGVAKSYVKLYQFRKALEHLHNAYDRHKDELSKLAEFWYLYGFCYRKCAKIWTSKPTMKRDRKGLENAKKCFQEGLAIEPQNTEILKETKVIERIHCKQDEFKKDILSYIDYMKTIPGTYDTNDVLRKADKETYKILSIDGGGLRGIIPTMILCEIEKRCHRRLSDVFNMFTGTSAGAVINCCINSTENIDSNPIPIHSAYYPLEVLVCKAQRIFPNPSNIRRLYSEKYSNKFCYEVCDESFRNLRLSQTLNDLVIPAVNYDGPLRTVYFTNYEAKASKEKDYLIKDILMAAIAAPSYFPPYKIPGLGYFLDGGLTVPNPCQKGFEEAVYHLNKKPEDLFVLSLGTGINSLDLYPQEAKHNKGLMHWASNTAHYIMVSQSHDVETFMRSKLRDRYNRFQVFFENAVPMDMYTHVPDLIEIATEFVEEKNDEINRIVEILLA